MSRKFIAMYLAFSIILCAFTAAAALQPTGVLFVQATGSSGKTKGPVIVIDAGHGGEDCGAVGMDGIYEKKLNFEISMCLYRLFCAAGYQTIMTRTEDKLLYTEEQNIPGKRKIYDLFNRVEILNSYDDAIFISIHMNDFSSQSAQGLQVWYKSGDEYSRGLAQAVKKQMVASLQPGNHRPIMESTSAIYVLTNSAHPALLVECGFLSNPTDCEKLQDVMYQKELSLAVFCAMIVYIETNKESVKTV